MKKLLGLTFPVLLIPYLLGLIPILVGLTFSFKRTIIEVELFSVGSTILSFIVILDYVRLRFRAVIAVISAIVLLFGDYYIKEDPFYNRFF